MSAYTISRGEGRNIAGNPLKPTINAKQKVWLSGGIQGEEAM